MPKSQGVVNATYHGKLAVQYTSSICTFISIKNASYPIDKGPKKPHHFNFGSFNKIIIRNQSGTLCLFFISYIDEWYGDLLG